MKTSHQKSTIDLFKEALSPRERYEMEQEYHEMLLSELSLARMEDDKAAMAKLTQVITESTQRLKFYSLTN